MPCISSGSPLPRHDRGDVCAAEAGDQQQHHVHRQRVHTLRGATVSGGGSKTHIPDIR